MEETIESFNTALTEHQSENTDKEVKILVTLFSFIIVVLPLEILRNNPPKLYTFRFTFNVSQVQICVSLHSLIYDSLKKLDLMYQLLFLNLLR